MEQTRKQLIVFGYGLPVIITAFVLHHAKDHGLGPISYSFLALAALCLIVSIIDIDKMKPVLKKWMVVANFIGTIITIIILTVLYYLAFGIPGIILRIMRKDLLDRKLDPEAKSYWVKREKAGVERIDFERQF